MKTAIETLSEVLISDINTIDLSAHMRVSDALKSMKIYANQKLDEAKDNNPNLNWIFKDSLDKLKDEL